MIVDGEFKVVEEPPAKTGEPVHYGMAAETGQYVWSMKPLTQPAPVVPDFKRFV